VNYKTNFGRNLTALLNENGLRKKIVAYVKNERANLNAMKQWH
jgi:hypothetical protein